jgi:hypothetical protein
VARRTVRADVETARRDILAGFERDNLVDRLDAVSLESAARVLSRLREIQGYIDALPADDELLAKTVRGVSVHPYLGHEREMRAEFRQQMKALRDSAGAAKAKTTGSISASLGAPARRTA